MNKAFIFDMDGVLIDSETVWGEQDAGFFGPEVTAKIRDQVLGSTMEVIYQIATRHGLSISEAEFYERYNELAATVYREANMTAGVDQLINALKNLGYKIGLVTSSPRLWVDWVLPRFKDHNAFDYILSIGDNPDLRSKPAPDGYLRAIDVLGSTPEQTIIVEDSNNGIASAKASGAYAIGFRQHHADDYELVGADTYVDSMSELEEYIRNK